MPAPDTNRALIASTLNALAKVGNCQVGRNGLITFRRLFPLGVTRSAFTIKVYDPNCRVVVRVLRSCSSDSSFAYGVVDETLLFNYVGGVGSYASTGTSYVFSGGAGAIMTQVNTFTAGTSTTPPSFTVSYNQPGPGSAYLAGYVWYQVVPNTLQPITFPTLKYDNRPGNVAEGFAYEAVNAQPYSMSPYQRYIKITKLLLPATNYSLTDPVYFDTSNGQNSTLIIKLSVLITEELNHGNSATQLFYYTVQTGSITVPPYTPLLRNTTTVTTTPPNILSNAIGLTLTPVLTTGSVSQVPTISFNGSVTTLPTPAICFVKMDVCCSGLDAQNYS